MKISISVVSPVFNEDKSLRPLVESLHKLIGDNLNEIIIVYHPNSSKECKDILYSLSNEYKKLITITQDQNEKGNGSAYRQGFNFVKGTHVLMIDSDGEMDLNSIPKMINVVINTNADVVIGSRYMNGGGIVGAYPPLKRILNISFQYIFRLLFWTKVSDLTYGFKLLKADILNDLHLEAKYQNIGVETTLKPIRLGLKVEQTPAIHRSRGYVGSSLTLIGNLRYPITALKILFWKLPLK